MKLKLNDSIKRSIEESFIESFFTKCMDLFVEKKSYEFRDHKEGLNKNVVNYGGLKDFSYYVDSRDVLQWKILSNNVKAITGEGVVNLYATIETKDLYSAINDLSNTLEINLDTSPTEVHCGPYASENDDIYWGLPKKIFVEGLVFDFKRYYLRYKSDGSVSGAILQYCGKDDYLEFPVFMRPINSLYGACLLLWPSHEFECVNNYSSFINNVSSKIILCEDFVLSEKINQIIFESKRIDYSKFFATSFKYISKSRLKECINLLRGRDVIYVPSGDVTSFKYIDVINHVHGLVRSFNIQKNIVIADDGSCKIYFPYVTDKFLQYSMNHCAVIDDYGSDIVLDIVRTAVSYEEYSHWCEFMGIFERSSGDQCAKFLNIGELTPAYVLNNLKPSFDSILSNMNFTLMYGDAASSKSLFLITVLYALASGFDVFDVDVLNMKRVMLVDFSSNKDIFSNKFHSVHFPYQKNNPVSSNFFAVIMDDVQFFDKFDLSSKSFHDFIEKHIIESQCDVIAFDNFPFNTHRGFFVEKWTEISEWLNHIRNKYSIGVIFSYESSSENDILLGILKRHQFSNIIKIERLIHQKGTNFVPFLADASFPENLMHIQYEHVSNCPKLNNSDGYYSKPFKDDLFDSKWIKIPKSKFKEEFSVHDDSAFSVYQRQILNYLKAKKGNGLFKRREIDDLLNKGPGTSRNVINDLIAKGLVKKLGDNARSIEYRFVGS